MAGTLTDVETDGAAPTRALGPVIVAGLALVVLLIAAWALTAGQQRSHIAVWFDAAPLDCTGSAPLIEDLGGAGEPLYVPVLELTRDLDCDLRVQVENRGRYAAELAGASLPFHGPASRGGGLAGELSPFGVQPAVDDDAGLAALDADYTIGHRLEPGQRLALRFELSLSPNACMSPGTMMWFDETPTLEVAALGLSGRSTPRGPAFAYRGTADSEC